MPEHRAGHSLIYDSRRNRFVMFGGLHYGFQDYRHLDDLWTLTLDPEPVWSHLDLPGGPGGREDHTAIYDSKRDRMVVFGGYVLGGGGAELWILEFSPEARWVKHDVPGDRPQARMRHGAAYDSVRDAMVVYGGDTVRENLNDLWMLSLEEPLSWKRLTPEGVLPPPNAAFSMDYDPVSDEVVVYGGYGPETWVLDWGGLVPAGLSLFTARRVGEKAILEWVVPEPDGIAGFEVYRQQDGLRARASGPLSGGPEFTFEDANVPLGAVEYWLLELGRAGSRQWHGPARLEAMDRDFLLRSVSPNPFVVSTTARYALARPSKVQVSIFDVTGRLVARLLDGVEGEGEHVVTWAGKGAAGQEAGAAVYFLTIRIGSESTSRKLVRLPSR